MYNVLELVKQKGFYPFEYTSDFGKLKEKLTRKEKCYRSLTDKNINAKEYEHVLNVWKKFEIKKMKDYHIFKMQRFVIDVFEKFRNNSFKNYQLCPSHYLSAPN